MYPHLSRNAIWKCAPKSVNDLNRLFDPIKDQQGKLGSSEKWVEMLAA
jgi:hypothetical protein